jgi:EmrB/QacA subfamily drug resistance transporter
VNRRAVAIAVACGGGYLAFLDTTIVNVSFPDIAKSFDGSSRAELSWILDAYFIVIAALLVPAGGIADRFGRKRVFLAGVALFVIASVACATAPSLELLIAARVLQGIAAAIIAPVSQALILPEFEVSNRAAGVGLWGAAAGLAAASGPPIGGLVTDTLGWRWIFLLNIPLGLLLLAAGRRALKESRDESATGLPDLFGVLLAAAALGLLALGIVEGESWGWTSTRVLGCFGVGAVLLGWLMDRSSRHPRPVIDPKLMRIPSFRRANIGTLLFAMAFFSTILGNILFLTGVWQYSVMEAGFATIPGPLLSAIVARPAGTLADRFGHRWVIVPGCLLYAAGLLVLRSAGAEPDWVGTWLPGMALTGTGIGFAFPALGAAAVRDIGADRFGVASAVNSAFRQFGAVLGTAILIAIVGTPVTLAAALSASDNAYLFAVFASLAASAVSMTITREPAEAGALPAPPLLDSRA